MTMTALNRSPARLTLKLAIAAALLVIPAAVTTAGYAQDSSALQIEEAEGPNPWSHLDFANNPNDFQFAVIADLTAGLRPGIFENAVEKLNLMHPEFVMCVGDLIEGGTEDTARLAEEWAEFEGWIDRLEAPFFYLPGNHDIGNEVMKKVWEERHGTRYYHFIYRDVLFLVADTDDPPRRAISDQQIEYFREVLENNQDVRWTMVFLHRPTWLPDYSGEVPLNSEKFETLFQGRPHTVFAGHDHKYSKAVRNGRNYYVLSTTGAQGRGETYQTTRDHNSKKLLGLEKGEFDHILWVTMTDQGPVVANLLLDGILDDDPVH